MRWREQLRVTWHLPAVLGALLGVAALALSANWLTSSPPRVVRLSGTHYEIGLQHGRLLHDEIHDVWNGYVVHGLGGNEGRSLEMLIRTARHYEPYVPQSLRDEMRGIADGAQLPYDHILVLNTFADAMLGKMPRLCSAVAVPSTRGGGILLGRNLDWVNHGIAHRTGVVFIVSATGEHRVMNVAWPGMVGVVTGMNGRGLAITLNMAFANDVDPNSMPSLVRIRDVLAHRETIEQAVSEATRTNRPIAMNWMIAQPDRAAVLELSGKQHAVRAMENGCAVTTNFYATLPLHGGMGSDRSASLRNALAGHAATPFEIERALLRVAFIGPSEGLVTIQSVVLDPAHHAADVAIGKLPAPSGRFYRVEFD